jgi:UDP-GlcNAc3NAcA epimerase
MSHAANPQLIPGGQGIGSSRRPRIVEPSGRHSGVKLVTIVGARPQFVKAVAVSRAISGRNRGNQDSPIEELIVHTGQHYDENLSQVFFDELEIPEPRYHLGVGSLPHGAQTGRMLAAIEPVLVKERPDWVLVYGDTNSTLAGALAAKKLNLMLAHVEAGLRSFNRRMPEEINRVLTDRISDALFCPTTTAVANLRHEGITGGVEQTGDVMYDASLYYRERARARSRVLDTLGLAPGRFALATVHRAENTDDPARLGEILAALAALTDDFRVVLALHPRTRKLIAQHALGSRLGSTQVIDPVSYLDMIRLEESARVIITDSGGVQKEAYFFRVPCVTLREETEWVETVESGWNRLAAADAKGIATAVREARAPKQSSKNYYGDGDAAGKIADYLAAHTAPAIASR